MNYQKIDKCRICGNTELIPFLDLGEQALTGRFPKNPTEEIDRWPLELVKCFDWCGLVQLNHSFDKAKLYNEHYGYRSSLNRSMADHLARVAYIVKTIAQPVQGDVIVDIGSNDGTFLNQFSAIYERIGIDPTAEKFRRFYDQTITRIPDFFKKEYVKKKAKIITTIAMLYDLENPMQFVEDVRDCLADDGIWAIEVADFDKLLANGIYDNVCHEHVEYYTLNQLEYMFKKAHLKIIDFGYTATNGGSLFIVAAKIGSSYPQTLMEIPEDPYSMAPYYQFRNRVYQHRQELLTMIDGRHVAGYGASTKGNVILQFCGITTEQIPFIF